LPHPNFLYLSSEDFRNAFCVAGVPLDASGFDNALVDIAKFSRVCCGCRTPSYRCVIYFYMKREILIAVIAERVFSLRGCNSLLPVNVTCYVMTYILSVLPLNMFSVLVCFELVIFVRAGFRCWETVGAALLGGSLCDDCKSFSNKSPQGATSFPGRGSYEYDQIRVSMFLLRSFCLDFLSCTELCIFPCHLILFVM